ncbi:hypothetical protein K7W42_01160 [Deinococcus sp. HMF7604]|uniref:hypothetical protein n=1 Tax=Deinococcus betulae TaxID=2873312 RepID=UPI001CCCE833|nr:hypothetical protein [Deinococcus betulae]MBZ9749461.1 hypothetical protein [Deinococcus betulae]
MTPEDWKAGMTNEADSVNDAAWSQDTVRAARHLRPRALWRDCVATSGAVIGLALPLAAGLWLLPGHPSSEQVAWFNLNAVVFTLVAGAIVGAGQVRWRAALAAFALFPLWFWLLLACAQTFVGWTGAALSLSSTLLLGPGVPLLAWLGGASWRLARPQRRRLT